MTEIPIFPGGRPPEATEEAMPPDGDWFGLFRALHSVMGRVARNLPDPRRVRLEKAQGVWPVRVDPIPMQLLANGFWYLDVPQMLGPGLGENWDVHSASATGFTAGTISGWVNVPGLASYANPTGALRLPFQAAGMIDKGKNQLFLRGRERLVFIGTSTIVLAAGSAAPLISLDGTGMRDEFVGEYLL